MSNSPVQAGIYTDPLEALEELIKKEQRQRGTIYLERAATFYGPKATFQQACEQVCAGTDPQRVERFQQCLLKIDDCIPYSQLPDDAWRRLRELALLRCSAAAVSRKPVLTFSPQALADGLSFQLPPASEPPHALPAFPAEIKDFHTAKSKLESLGFGKNPNVWSAADWQLLGFYNDIVEAPEESSAHQTVCERTPVFLANERVGRVLWLVAERLKGPPRLITPHWWKLGLVPLGKGHELLTAIHCGFLTVLNAKPDVRFQFRWWLELHAGGGGWHEEIGEARSIEVAAACVARALLDDAAKRPLLDARAGVSATLLDGTGETIANPRVGPVGFTPRKLDWAQRAGILTFLAEKESVGLASSTTDLHDLKVQCIQTLDDAYQAIVTTAMLVQRYKQEISQRWEQRWNDTPTDQEFIDASEQHSE